MPLANPRTPNAQRVQALDALRGAAMLWMLAFHFSYDLNLFGLISPQQHFTRDPFWMHQRSAIVSLFLFCAGAGQALALSQAQVQRWGSGFWKRWGQVAACAVLVSASSFYMFPQAWVSFGVLHGMALMLLIVRAIAPRPNLLKAWWWLALLAGAMLLLPLLVQHPLFDTRWTNWLGLTTRKPITVDWVPLAPWLGVFLLGYLFSAFCAAFWTHRRSATQLSKPSAFTALKPLATLGRWPLSFYMIHQPVLLGALQLGRWLKWW